MLAIRRAAFSSATRQAWRRAPQRPETRQSHTLLNRPAMSPTNGRQQQREFHFLPLLGIWGAKHLSMYTLYNTAKAYGWPKVYRRLLEQNRAMFVKQGGAVTHQQQLQIQSLLKLAIRSPPQLASQLSDHATVVLPYLKALAERAEPAVPAFIRTAARVILQSTKPMKILQDMLHAAPATKGRV